MLGGYLHPLYAQSFSELGTPLYLPASRGWLISRQIPGTVHFDAMGPYPLFFCENWAALTQDLEALKDELVSVTLVIDPFARLPLDRFAAYFDRFKPYKDHYLLDLSLPLEESISSKRRKEARKALREVTVEVKTAPEIDLEEWTQLYAYLVRRHQITGIRAFSRQSFASQLEIPNTHYFRVIKQGQVVGGNLFYLQDDVAYSHLSAYTDEGYASHAGYAVKWAAIEYFKPRLRWIEFGGGSAAAGAGGGGLDSFKIGWSSQTLPSFFCAKILNPERYADLVRSQKAVDSAWFPAYRSGDF